MTQLKYIVMALAVLAAAPRAALGQTPPPPPTNAAGNWDLVVSMPQGTSVVMMTVEQNGDKITGKLLSPTSPEPLVGTVVGRDLEVRGALVFLDGNLDLDFDGIVNGNRWTGTLKFGVLGEFSFAGDREVPAKDQAPASDQTPAAPPASGTSDTPAAASPASAADVTGKWNVVITITGIGDFPMAATLAQDGTRVTGTFVSPMGQVPVTGTMTGNSLALDCTATTPQGSYTLAMTGQLNADGLAGTATVAGLGEAAWTAARAQP